MMWNLLMKACVLAFASSVFLIEGSETMVVSANIVEPFTAEAPDFFCASSKPEFQSCANTHTLSLFS